MSLSLRTNIDSISAQTELSRTTSALSKTFERLSSGLRINSASDDPAGLALADKLNSDAVLANVAMRNANDGLSLTNVAESALDEINNMLSRMSELAEQSANGTYTNTQRSALSSEFLALGSEIERISGTTTFNSMTLLSNSRDITLQVGFDSSVNSRITISGVRSTLDSLGLAASGSSRLTFSIITISTEGSQDASANALSAVRNAISSLGSTRGTLGAVESRLTHAISSLEVARENYMAAESRIRDADIAQETADMVRLQVLQQAGVAVLAQANLQPETVLKLLG
jgi:flagellin